MYLRSRPVKHLVKGTTSCRRIWYAPGVQFRTKKMMDAPEPMIVEFNLKDWMNPVATASSNPDVIARTKPLTHYRGLQPLLLPRTIHPVEHEKSRIIL